MKHQNSNYIISFWENIKADKFPYKNYIETTINNINLKIDNHSSSIKSFSYKNTSNKQITKKSLLKNVNKANFKKNTSPSKQERQVNPVKTKKITENNRKRNKNHLITTEFDSNKSNSYDSDMKPSDNKEKQVKIDKSQVDSMCETANFSSSIFKNFSKKFKFFNSKTITNSNISTDKKRNTNTNTNTNKIIYSLKDCINTTNKDKEKVNIKIKSEQVLSHISNISNLRCKFDLNSSQSYTKNKFLCNKNKTQTKTESKSEIINTNDLTSNTVSNIRKYSSNLKTPMKIKENPKKNLMKIIKDSLDDSNKKYSYIKNSVSLYEKTINKKKYSKQLSFNEDIVKELSKERELLKFSIIKKDLSSSGKTKKILSVNSDNSMLLSGIYSKAKINKANLNVLLEGYHFKKKEYLLLKERFNRTLNNIKIREGKMEEVRRMIKTKFVNISNKEKFLSNLIFNKCDEE